MSALANQETLNNLAIKFGGRTPVRIHFLDNSSKMFLVESSYTAKDVLMLILDKFGVVDVENTVAYYGLFQSKDGAAIDGALTLDSNIAEIVNSWGQSFPDAKLVFMIRLFMPSIWGLQHMDVLRARLNSPQDLSIDAYLENAEIIDQNLLHLQYLQAVYHVITGQYPTSEEQGLQLGCLHFLFKFGAFNDKTHIAGFLGNRIVEFIPVKHLRKGSKSLDQWEQELLTSVAAMSSASTPAPPGNAANITPAAIVQHRYMREIFKMDFYGNTFFRSSQRAARHAPENPILGIYNQGIIVFDKNRRVHKRYRIEEIYRWGFKPTVMFNFEVKATEEVGGTLEFLTAEGQAISDLLTDYALAFLKERDLAALRSGVPSSSSAGSPVAGSKKKPVAGQAAPVARQNTLYSTTVAHRAIVLIQAVIRSYLTRVKVTAMIERMLASGELVAED